MQVCIKQCVQLIQMLFGSISYLVMSYIEHFLQSRVMLAWLFLEKFWTPDRVKSYLSKVPPVKIFFH
jgi:hypothetical protein